jgi:FKBP-type peptidyl-prolyl cis-trans isomerase
VITTISGLPESLFKVSNPNNFKRKKNTEMKRINLSLIVVFALLIGLSGCMNSDNTDDTEKVKENEVAIENYLKTDSLGSKAIRDSSGLYYIIRKANPNGEVVKIGDAVTVKFNGYLLDGKKVLGIEKDSSYTFPANGYVTQLPGLERSIFLMKSGEKATFFLPFYLAFGSYERVNVPAYSPIRLEVELLKTRTEAQQIEDFITKKGYTKVERSAGNLVIIRTNTVTGDTLGVGKAVSVKYIGKFLNDKKFSEGTVNFNTGTSGSGSAIVGMDRAVRKMKKTEKAIIIFPSSLGYKQSGTADGVIAPYTPLQFEVEIL